MIQKVLTKKEIHDNENEKAECVRIWVIVVILQFLIFQVSKMTKNKQTTLLIVRCGITLIAFIGCVLSLIVKRKIMILRISSILMLINTYIAYGVMRDISKGDNIVVNKKTCEALIQFLLIIMNSHMVTQLF